MRFLSQFNLKMLYVCWVTAFQTVLSSSVKCPYDRIPLLNNYKTDPLFVLSRVCTVVDQFMAILCEPRVRHGKSY